MAKCPVCGAPMERDACGYCGYVEKTETPQVSNTNSIPQQVIHTQILQSQGVMAAAYGFCRNYSGNESEEEVDSPSAMHIPGRVRRP